MFNQATTKKRFNKANLYFVGSFAVLVIATTLLLLLLKQQNQTNMQAQLLLSNAGNYKNEIQKQQQLLTNLTSENAKIIDSKTIQFYADPIKLTDLTRYFDEVARTLSADGTTFDITTISYAEGTSQGYIPASITFTSTNTNLVRFLRVLEQSGISEEGNSYLMELSNINVSVNSGEDTGIYTINLGLRIYNFYE
jgi:hypothetical protein